MLGTKIDDLKQTIIEGFKAQEATLIGAIKASGGDVQKSLAKLIQKILRDVQDNLDAVVEKLEAGDVESRAGFVALVNELTDSMKKIECSDVAVKKALNSMASQLQNSEATAFQVLEQIKGLTSSLSGELVGAADKDVKEKLSKIEKAIKELADAALTKRDFDDKMESLVK